MSKKSCETTACPSYSSNRSRKTSDREKPLHRQRQPSAPLRLNCFKHAKHRFRNPRNKWAHSKYQVQTYAVITHTLSFVSNPRVFHSYPEMQSNCTACFDEFSCKDIPARVNHHLHSSTTFHSNILKNLPDPQVIITICGILKNHLKQYYAFISGVPP